MKRKTLVFLKLFSFVNDREYMKIIYKNCSLRNEYESDFHSNLHYLPVVKIRYEKILSCTGFEPMTSAVLVQFSTN